MDQRYFDDDATLRRWARVAGALYLVIIVGAGFAEGFVRTGMIVPGDARATAEAIAAAAGLYRFGLLADLIAFLADAAVAVLFYVLLRSVNHTVALLAAAFRLVAHPAIAAVNLLNHWAGGILAQQPDYLAGFSPEQLDGLTLFALELHGFGYLVGGAFFGVHLVLLGWLMLRSVRFPGWLGAMLCVAGVAYFVETTAHVAVPALETLSAMLVVAAAAAAELTLCGWLLVRGIRTAEPEPPAGT